ncbi:deleted in azoospermia-like-B [Dendronephthya gigantea]|uniref:deleted in azoospermia-like-B n=1 Tax=Dendronephthya gigantea TaxID=151771 RepID=UPI001069E72D|nr:deleted in azoospermia-like-B [Dendronephthya gigantea]XP_028391574.1 deleted in azoospermia-like-B [Dendronephthya gigantea]XP_028391575.1 deleted in azoospermia-like-B [Dendronephthya gigantea]
MAEIQTYLYGKKFPNRIFVGGLPINTSAYELADFFNVFGHVIESKIILDDSGLSKGYGFITFEHKSTVKKVESMGIIYFKNKKINIGPAVRKEASTVQPEMVMWAQSSLPSGQQTQQSTPYFNPTYIQQPLDPYNQVYTNDGVYYMMYPNYNPAVLNQNYMQPYTVSSYHGNCSVYSDETRSKKYTYNAKRKNIPPRFMKK